jgi:uncharacterized protein YjcR
MRGKKVEPGGKKQEARGKKQEARAKNQVPGARKKAPAARKQHEKRELAKDLFVKTNLTARAVAERIGVQEKTVGVWRMADNWDDERATLNASPIQIIKEFNNEILEIMNTAKAEQRRLTSKEVDIIKKLTKGAKELRNEATPQVIMEVLYVFLSDLEFVAPELAKGVAPHMQNYVQGKLNREKERV